jgi:hypothetical protein
MFLSNKYSGPWSAAVPADWEELRRYRRRARIAIWIAVVCTALMLVAGVLSCIAYVLIWSPGGWSLPQINLAKKHGDLTILAIKAYREDHGRYPARLEDICPKYMPQILQPPMGKHSWEYWVNEQGDDFSLSVDIADGDSEELLFIKNRGWKLRSVF